MKKVIIIATGFMMIGVFSSFFNFIFGDGLNPSTRMGHKISSEIGNKMKEKYGLNYMGIAESGVNGKYRKIGFNFNCKRVLTKEEGRKLLLHCVRDVLDSINSYPNFKQYMVRYPFTGENTMVVIFIQPNIIPEVFYPNIAIFSFYDNALHYNLKSPEKKFGFISNEKESFEEAMRLVESQK